jgi:hypothetical protein
LLAEPPAHAPRILVVENDLRHQNWVGRILRTLSGRIELVADHSSVADLQGFDLIAINYDNSDADSSEQLFRRIDALTPRPHVLILSGDRDRYVRLFQLLEGYRLTNLLANNCNVDPMELLVTVQKIVRKDIFGIEKYFAWGVETMTAPIRRSADKDEVIEAAAAYAEKLNINPRLAGLFCTAVEEFSTNALYNAPVDDEGRPRFAHLSRAVDVALEPGEQIDVTFCCDGRTLGLAMSDSFGSLGKEQVLDCMAKCFRKGDDQVSYRSGGAGLGLYFSGSSGEFVGGPDRC